MFPTKLSVYTTLARHPPKMAAEQSRFVFFFSALITLQHINAANMSSARYPSPSFSPLWRPFASRRINELMRRFQSDAGSIPVHNIKSLKDDEVETVLRHDGKKFMASPIAWEDQIL